MPSFNYCPSKKHRHCSGHNLGKDKLKSQPILICDVVCRCLLKNCAFYCIPSPNINVHHYSIKVGCFYLYRHGDKHTVKRPRMVLGIIYTLSKKTTKQLYTAQYLLTGSFVCFLKSLNKWPLNIIHTRKKTTTELYMFLKVKGHHNVSGLHL